MNRIEEFSKSLFKNPKDQIDFIKAVKSPKNYGSCLLKTDPTLILSFQTKELPFQAPSFVHFLDESETPGQNPLHKKGAYYCLDPASVFMAMPLTALSQKPELVFDLCAAPGGKTVFSKLLLNPTFLLSNEVIYSRCRTLISNIKRCSIKEIRLFCKNSKILSDFFENAVDVVLVDAPCSGQSLLAKSKKASNPSAFNSKTIKGNSKRQKKILSDAIKMVKPNGHLLYMTCTYSKEENEDIVQWVMNSFEGFCTIEVPSLKEYKSELSDFYSYRLWPHKHNLAGGFCALLKKKSTNIPNVVDIDCSPYFWAG